MQDKGKQIAEKSFEIIRERMGNVHFSVAVEEIVVRIAHTTGDVAFGCTFHIPEDALKRGIEAAIRGCRIITDVEMVRTGIRKAWAELCGCEVACFLSEPEVMAQSAATGETRSALGMRMAGDRLNDAIIAIGNAPTALFTVLDMIREGKVNPALIVGVPVGFVGAMESKQALYDSGYPAVTNLGERGGSTIAAAIINGILFLADKEKV